jgi:lysozyme
MSNSRFILALALAVAVTAVARLAAAATVCPGPSTVEGIDVSEYQGNINWGQVKASGREFAIIRTGDGMYQDPYFAQNWSGAKAAGLIRGVYQFFEPGEDAVAQANLMLSMMGAIGPGDLPPMIDVEVTGGQSGATITSKIHQWVNTVQAATGRKPLVYTGTWFWDPNVGSGDFSSYPLVESYYCSSCCPNLPNPWSDFAMWQYSSTGAVPGISGNVDLDKFKGTMADLQLLAGGSLDWSAAFVSQSFPYASTAITMTVNESVGAFIEMKNTGAKTWDGNTKLGTTQPRDRASVFVAGDWQSAGRPSVVSGTVAPGQSHKFNFTWHAPSAPGEYHEFFGVVQEGVHWFSDSGQGGPPDNQLEAWIKVVEADYHGEFVAQSYLGADKGAVTIAIGETMDGWIDLKNVGLQPWKAGETKLAPSPRDKPSAITDASWLSPTRVSTLAADVAPGAVGRFPLKISGNQVGDFDQTFALVEEAVTWFSDAPKGGGPADDFLRVHVIVTPANSSAGDGGVRGVGNPGGGGGDGGSPEGGGGNPSGNNPTGVSAHGGCSTSGSPAPAPSLLLFAFAALALIVRRRFHA